MEKTYRNSTQAIAVSAQGIIDTLTISLSAAKILARSNPDAGRRQAIAACLQAENAIRKLKDWALDKPEDYVYVCKAEDMCKDFKHFYANQ